MYTTQRREEKEEEREKRYLLEKLLILFPAFKPQVDHAPKVKQKEFGIMPVLM
jgi:hypothetical protein